jgi:hypothetical protein
VAKTGVYYGYAQVLPPNDGKTELCQDDVRVHPMVMSLGWNPFYKNEILTAVSLGPNCLGLWLQWRRKSTSCMSSVQTFMDMR